MIHWNDLKKEKPKNSNDVLIYYVDLKDSSFQGISIGNVNWLGEWGISDLIKGDEYDSSFKITHWAPLTELNYPNND